VIYDIKKKESQLTHQKSKIKKKTLFFVVIYDIKKKESQLTRQKSKLKKKKTLFFCSDL
jgi:CRISPR/Cas system-associated endoribonuclease Cas2